MNNDPPPADLPRNEDNTSANTSDDAPVESAAQRQDEISPGQKRAQVQAKKKHDFLSSLMNNLDIMIYAELSIIYYMEYVPGTLQNLPLLTYPAARSSVSSFELSTR